MRWRGAGMLGPRGSVAETASVSGKRPRSEEENRQRGACGVLCSFKARKSPVQPRGHRLPLGSPFSGNTSKNEIREFPCKGCGKVVRCRAFLGKRVIFQKDWQSELPWHIAQGFASLYIHISGESV